MKDKGGREMHESFGARLKFYRQQKNLSLYDLERITGVSPAYLNRLERGERKAPSYPIVEKIATALGVSVYRLLNVDVQSESKLRSVYEVLILNEFTINDRMATRNDKEALVELLQTVLCSDEPAGFQDGTRIVLKAKELWELVR